jgi:hypothetical protein
MMDNPLSTILNRLRDSRPVRYGAMAAIGVTAGDVDALTNATTAKHALRTLGTGSKGLHAIKHSTETLVKSIDPRLEEMSPEDILGAGAAHIGNRKSPFISNPSIITKDEWQKLELLVEHKLLTENELVSFYNLLGTLHQKHAHAALEYKANPTAANRTHVVRLNHDAWTAPAVMLVHSACKKPALCADAENGLLTMNSLRKSYPNLSKAIPLIQMIDDQSDVVLDTMDEIRTGRPSANFILAKAHEQGGLLHESGRLSPSVVVHSSRAFRDSPRIAINALHPALQRGLEAADKEFRNEAASFNPLTRSLLLASWENGLKQGIKPAQNERLDATRLALR